MKNLNTKILSGLPVVMPTQDNGLAKALRAAGDSMLTAKAHAASLRTLRSEMLTSLLSGTHTIPESYDALLETVDA